MKRETVLATTFVSAESGSINKNWVCATLSAYSHAPTMAPRHSMLKLATKSISCSIGSRKSVAAPVIGFPASEALFFAVNCTRNCRGT